MVREKYRAIPLGIKLQHLSWLTILFLKGLNFHKLSEVEVKKEITKKRTTVRFRCKSRFSY